MGIAAQTQEVLQCGRVDGIDWEPGRPRAVAAYRARLFGAVLFVVDREQPRAIVVTASPGDGGMWQDEEEFGFAWSAHPFERPTLAEMGGPAALGGWVEVADPRRAFRVATGRAAAEVTSLVVDRAGQHEALEVGMGGAFVYGWPTADGDAPRAVFEFGSDRFEQTLG